MKSFLAGCGVAVLLLVVVVGVLLVWAFWKGSNEQQEFFDAVLSGDSSRVMAMFDPALRQEIDEPVLAEWIAAVRNRLGNWKGLRKTDFNTSSRVENGVRITESRGTVLFEHGEAESALVLQNGKIVEFNVSSDKLTDWFTTLSDTSLYERQAEACLRAIMANNVAEAHAMFHDELKKVLSQDQLQAFVDETVPASGSLEEVTLVDKAFRSGNVPSLELAYRLKCEKQALDAKVGFQFPGLKGYILSLTISPPQ